MSHDDIKASWDDDVLTGELMVCSPFSLLALTPQFGLPSAPHCRPPASDPNATLPSYCDVHAPPPNGYLYPPLAEDPRTGLIRHDWLRRLGDPAVWFVSGDLGWHGWWLKFHEHYERVWRTTVQGRVWSPPAWLEAYADPADPAVRE